MQSGTAREDSAPEGNQASSRESAETRPKKTHLTIQNRGGSVEHYYHFLLGFLLPLINYRFFLRADFGDVLIRSCGVLDPLINELNIPGVFIISKDDHSRLAANQQGDHLYASINGFDSPHHNHQREPKRCREKVLLRLGLHGKEFSHNDSIRPRVLMINRLPADPFYESEECEIKTSGSGRGSIPNFNEMVSALSAFKPTAITLEGLSLREQAWLFREHDLIIAQHGAALANLIFCRESTRVIEICPREKIDEFQSNGDFFAELASQLNLRFHRMIQADSHAMVSPGLLLQVAEMALAQDA